MKPHRSYQPGSTAFLVIFINYYLFILIWDVEAVEQVVLLREVVKVMAVVPVVVATV